MMKTVSKIRDDDMEIVNAITTLFPEYDPFFSKLLQDEKVVTAARGQGLIFLWGRDTPVAREAHSLFFWLKCGGRLRFFLGNPHLKKIMRMRKNENASLVSLPGREAYGTSITLGEEGWSWEPVGNVIVVTKAETEHNLSSWTSQVQVRAFGNGKVKGKSYTYNGEKIAEQTICISTGVSKKMLLSLNEGWILQTTEV